jgi:predicted Zn-dependent protease with MMP-like domain
MTEPRHSSEQEFEALVSSALDELPGEFQRALEHVAVVVSDRDAESVTTSDSMRQASANSGSEATRSAVGEDQSRHTPWPSV